ncbi:hypothetical protein DDV98_05750 [Streptomyces sp. IB2014 011-12]|nr:hypothetical protein DDV98_05750 [Streptomyces sp. IB2014 011-12]
MVSSPHEAHQRIFQEHPGLFASAFRALGIPFPEPVAVSLMDTELTEIRPLEPYSTCGSSGPSPRPPPTRCSTRADGGAGPGGAWPRPVHGSSRCSFATETAPARVSTPSLS